MALGSINEYFAWIERESPSVEAQEVTRAFLLELDERPWAAPSVPVPEACARADVFAVSGGGLGSGRTIFTLLRDSERHRSQQRHREEVDVASGAPTRR